MAPLPPSEKHLPEHEPKLRKEDLRYGEGWISDNTIWGLRFIKTRSSWNFQLCKRINYLFLWVYVICDGKDYP